MISIPENILKNIFNEAEVAFPNECCGLLVGRQTLKQVSVIRSLSSPNTKIENGGAGRTDSFEIDPKIHFDLLRELEGGDEQIIGHYHSHPGKSPEPSLRDLKSAYEENHVWLIIGVDKNGRANAAGAFYLNCETGNIVELEIKQT